MKMLTPLALAALLAACQGTAPAVQNPSAALNQPQACRDVNAPPPGHRGPVSPYSLGCAPATGPAVAPAGVHDYSTGQPPRAVRGETR